MNNRQITAKQMECMIIMFLLGSSTVVGTSSKANQDSWICILIASAMVLPIILIYCRILTKYPGKNFFDIIVIVFGKTAGKIIGFLYVWYALHLGGLVLRNFSEFLHVQNVSDTPSIVILCFAILICIWSVSSCVENMGRISKFTFFVVACSLLLTTLLSFGQMNFRNIMPVLSTDLTNLLSSSYSIFSFPLAELVVILPIFSFVPTKESPKKILLKGYGIALIFLMMANLRNLFVLGVPTLKLFYFSSYQSVGVVKIGEFFTRFEVLVGVNFLLCIIVKVSVCLFSSSIGLAKLCNNKEYKRMIAPCGLIMIFLATTLYQNTEEMFQWIDIYSIYAVPFQVILPIAIFAVIEIKTRINKNSALPKSESMGSLD